ncbi:MAG: CoA ester lyase [Actinomycetota bacterium]|nr:CoA ester lyase [Actinomycetota bacterium]
MSPWVASSYLFVPGVRRDRFDRAAGAGAGAIILDLEDAVAPTEKVVARGAVRSWLQGPDHVGYVRVNAFGSPWFEDDLASIVGTPGLAGVVLPKTECSDTANRVANGTGAPVIALIETARGLAAARELASTDGVGRLALGHLDLAINLRCDPTRDAMLAARSELVLASVLAGISAPIDGVTTAVRDAAAVTDDAGYGKSLGMGAKLAIHPVQVPQINAVFAPSDDEIAWARSVLDAAGGGSVIALEGQMVDKPVIERARRLLQSVRQP